MQIDLTDDDIEQIKNACCSTAAEAVSRMVDKEVRDQIRRAINDSIASITTEALRPIVEDITLNGFPKTDGYGNSQGKITLRERVSKDMFPERSYDSPIHRIYREILDRELKSELGDLFKRAKAEVATLLEGEILDKLRTFLRDGMAFKK